MKNKEFEKKSTITREEYLQIKNLLIGIKGNRILQMNYYFDSTSFQLYKQCATLRVRQIDDKLQLQYKFNKVKMNKIWISDEYTKDIDKMPQKIKLNGIETEHIGSLITEREQFTDHDCVICLDKNYYLGFLDYEIEVEFKSKESSNISFLNLPYKNSPGKYTRFINKMLEQIKEENITSIHCF